MTRPEFDRLMVRLTWLKFAPTDLETHWEGLRDVPADKLGKAITRCIKSQAEFPTPFELRTYIDAEGSTVTPAEDRSAPLEHPVMFQTPFGNLRINRSWSYYCEDCSDTGWRSLWCGDSKRQPWLESVACNRKTAHLSHEWAEKCRCHDTNPDLVRKREAAAKYAGSGNQRRAS